MKFLLIISYLFFNFNNLISATIEERKTESETLSYDLNAIEFLKELKDVNKPLGLEVLEMLNDDNPILSKLVWKIINGIYLSILDNHNDENLKQHIELFVDPESRILNNNFIKHEIGGIIISHFMFTFKREVWFPYLPDKIKVFLNYISYDEFKKLIEHVYSSEHIKMIIDCYPGTWHIENFSAVIKIRDDYREYENYKKKYKERFLHQMIENLKKPEIIQLPVSYLRLTFAEWEMEGKPKALSSADTSSCSSSSTSSHS